MYDQSHVLSTIDSDLSRKSGTLVGIALICDIFVNLSNDMKAAKRSSNTDSHQSVIDFVAKVSTQSIDDLSRIKRAVQQADPGIAERQARSNLSTVFFKFSKSMTQANEKLVRDQAGAGVISDERLNHAGKWISKAGEHAQHLGSKLA